MTRLSWALRLLLFLIIAFCIAPYVLITLTLNGQPAAKHFNGWLAVITKSAPSTDQVRLDVEAVAPGAPGSRPYLVYSVGVCGTAPFDGVLVMGGDARLTGSNGTGPLVTASEILPAGQAAPAIDRISPLSFYDETDQQRLDLGEVDAANLQFHSVPKCVSSIDRGSDPNSPFFGQAATVTGQARAPVQHGWNIGPFRAPRTTSSWPLVGTLPGTTFNDRGDFHAVSGLTGDYQIPIPLIVRVGSGGLTPLAVVEEARPETVDISSLDWAAFGPLQPTARLANSSSISSWQAWQVAAAIAIGVGGSLIGAITLDSLRGKGNSPSDSAGHGKIVQPTIMTNKLAHPGNTKSGSSHACLVFGLLATGAVWRWIRKTRSEPTTTHLQ